MVPDHNRIKSKELYLFLLVYRLFIFTVGRYHLLNYNNSLILHIAKLEILGDNNSHRTNQVIKGATCMVKMLLIKPWKAPITFTYNLKFFVTVLLECFEPMNFHQDDVPFNYVAITTISFFKPQRYDNLHTDWFPTSSLSYRH